MDVVNDILQKAARESEKFKPITVEKHLDVEIDVGNLLSFDINEVNIVNLRSKKDQYLQELTRDNTQLLLNKVWELPTKRVDEAIVAELPKPRYVLPRSLPVPKPKEPTRWEKFAQEKGIVKTKKAKLEWDEVLKKWIPRYGSKKAAAEAEKDWLIELPGNADPMEDQYAKKKKQKLERVAKNEMQRMRNIAAARKVKVPRIGMLPADNLSSKDLHKAATVARSSTASGGKFQAKLPKEKSARDVKALMPVAPVTKRKFSNLTSADEKSSNLNFIDRILNKKPKLNIEAAVNREINTQEVERSEEKKTQKPKTGRGAKKGKGTKKGKGAGKQKPKAGKKSGGGRKRR